MAGSATLGTNLLDDLVVDVIDGLREELHVEFGVRAYRVFLVKRTWSGSMIGEGKATDVEIEIRPQPKLDVWTGRKYELQACGLNEMGDIRLTEVSLTYTYDDLCGGALKPNQQWMFKITEAHGQGQPPAYFVPSKAPFVDRTETLGWIVWLRKVDVPGGT